MLDRRFLDEPLGNAAQTVDLHKDPRFLQAVDLAERGSYEQAAILAQELLDEGSHDIRSMVHYLLGWFLQGGVVTLQDIVRRLHALVSDEFDALAPATKTAKTVDSALSWLFRSLVEPCKFHTEQKDALWNQWLDSLAPDAVSATISACAELRAALGEAIESPHSTSQIARLERWLRESIEPAVRRRAQASAEAARRQDQAEAQAGTPPADRSAAADQRAGSSANAEPVRHTRDAPWPADQAPSPAMQALLQKLAAFAHLVEQGDMVKAAIVANNIREIINNFDPLLYLPKLFANYVRLLSESIEELMPYWQESDGPTWQALEQFYRTDLDGFLDSSSE